MYIFMIYALIFIAGVFLENLALKSIHVWEATIKYCCNMVTIL